METLIYSITGVPPAESIEVIESYDQASARCIINATNCGAITIGSLISVSLGFVAGTGNGLIFTGYVQSINSERLPGHYIIEASDVLIRAAEHMIVSTDLDNPFRRSNISAEDLVEDLLNEAGIVNYTAGASGFTLATGSMPVEFQLVSAWDAVQQVANIIAWHCYADMNGLVHFVNMPPTPSGAPVATYTTGGAGNILVIRRSQSTDNLRNKVIVLGYPPIVSVRSAASPYLPAGFYKTAIISSTLIDTQWMSDTAAIWNLAKWNKLTEVMTVEALGDYQRHARQTVHVTETFTGVNNDWFIKDIQHTFGGGGYTIRMTLVR